MIIRAVLVVASIAFLPAFASAFGLVNNSGFSGEDSLTVYVASLDSVGNPTYADSFFVVVFRSGSNDVVFSDSGTTAMPGMDTLQLRGVTHYYYHRAVADIDGAGEDGLYAGAVIAKRSDAVLLTANRFSFQVVSVELDDQLAKISELLDSLQSQDDWAGNIRYDLEDSVLRLRGMFVRGIQSGDSGFVVKGGGGAPGLVVQGGLSVPDGISANIDGVVTPADTNESGKLLARLEDSLSFQGGGSNPLAIADAVWDEARSGHTVPGTYGFYLDASVSGVSGGSGAYPVTVVVYDSSLDKHVAYAGLTVHAVSLAAVVAVGSAGGDGSARFNLDADSFVVSAVAPGYLFDPFDTMVVAGPSQDTVFGSRFDPGTPAGLSLCRVYGYLYGIDGQPLEGVTVSARLTAGPARSTSAVISPYAVSTTSDENGYYFLDLVRSVYLEPSGTQYEISAIYPSGTIVRRTVEVPDQPTWLFGW